jgi:hypothetical protein
LVSAIQVAFLPIAIASESQIVEPRDRKSRSASGVKMTSRAKSRWMMILALNSRRSERARRQSTGSRGLLPADRVRAAVPESRASPPLWTARLDRTRASAHGAMARSSRSMPRSAAARRSALALLLALACPCALAKVEQGTLKIDSVTTEQLIGKFGVAESGDVQLKLTTSRDGWERGRHELHVLFFHDDNYRKWEKAIQAGSLCRDRNKMADIEHKVDLPHELATHHGHGWEYFVDPETGKSYRVSLDTGESEWNSPHNATRMREEGPVNRITHRETVFSTKLEHTYPIRGRNPTGERVLKAAHWYVVISDCALEFYEAHPPPMHYELTMFNGGSHLPSDLNGMGVLYFFLLLAMVIGAGPAFASATNQYRRLGRVHALVALLFAAYAAQSMSFFLELWHLSVFARDGKGFAVALHVPRRRLRGGGEPGLQRVHRRRAVAVPRVRLDNRVFRLGGRQAFKLARERRRGGFGGTDARRGGEPRLKRAARREGFQGGRRRCREDRSALG